MSFLYVLFLLNIIALIHELGHYLTAKFLCKIHVEEFAVGIGKKVGSFEYKNTVYSLRWIPFGGFNRINTDSLDDAPYFRKTTLLFSGSFFNIASALLILWIWLVSMGVQTPSNENIIGKVIPNSPAAKFGFLEGDKIIKINNATISNWSDIINQQVPEDKIEVVVERNSLLHRIVVTHQYSKEAEHTEFGIQPKTTGQEVSPIQAFTISLGKITWAIDTILGGLKDEIIINKGEGLAGPIGVLKITNEAVQRGFGGVVEFFIIFSLNIAIFNLLPLPSLDGGQIVTYTILRFFPNLKSKVRYSQMVGIALILGLVTFATYKDILRLLSSAN